MACNPEEDSDLEGRKVSPVEISQWYDDPRGVHKVVGTRRGEGHTTVQHTSVGFSDKLRLPEGVSESGKLRPCSRRDTRMQWKREVAMLKGRGHRNNRVGAVR
jgi:hypothetical protein